MKVLCNHLQPSWRKLCLIGLLIASTILAGSIRVSGAGGPVYGVGRPSGQPWIRLEAQGPPDSAWDRAYREDSQRTPISLILADLSGDSVLDLVSGYETESGGVLTLRPGDPASIFPSSLKYPVEEGDTRQPFRSETSVLDVPWAPRLLASGDFDSDGAADLVAADAGGRSLSWIVFNSGGLVLRRTIPVPGRIDAIAAADVNRRDGVVDLLVAATGNDGSFLMVFEGPRMALLSEPELIHLPGPATAIQAFDLDRDSLIDILVAAGGELVHVVGRDRGLRSSRQTRAKAGRAVVNSVSSPFSILALAIGDFVGTSEMEAAVLDSDGRIHYWGLGEPGFPELGITPQTNFAWANAGERRARLERVKVSSLLHDDLLVWSPGATGFDLLLTELPKLDRRAAKNSLRTDGFAVSYQTPSGVVALVPALINRDGLQDLVALGPEGVTLLTTRPQSIFQVNSSGTEPDGHLDGRCATAPCEDGECTGPCTLAAAIQEANFVEGLDSISFALPFGTVIPETHVFSDEAIVLDGLMVSAGAMRPGIVLDGKGAPFDGVFLEASGCLITGLVIHSWRDVGGAVGGRGVHVAAGSANQIQQNYIGTTLGGGTPVGTPSSAKSFGIALDRAALSNLVCENVVGSHDGGIIVESSNNIVTGNYVGVGVDGRTELGSRKPGITLTGDSNFIGDNVIGGNIDRSSGFREVDGLEVTGRGNMINGNYFGLNRNNRLIVSGFGGDIRIAGEANLLEGNVIASSLAIVSSENFLFGNRIGTNAAGDQALALSSLSLAGDGNSIGGVGEEAGNIIVGGVRLSAANDNEIINNKIGTLADGVTETGFAPLNGVFLGFGSSRNVVRDNIVANTRGPKIEVRDGRRNTFSENSIFGPTGLGIDLGGDGITSNGSHGGETGPNDWLNAPVLTQATPDEVAGVVDAGTGEFTIELFANSACDEEAGVRNGETFVASMTVSSGQFVFNFATPALLSGEFVTATVTDALGNTSEFSNCVRSEAIGQMFVVNSEADMEEPAQMVGDGRCDTGRVLEGGAAECTLWAAIQESNSDPDKDFVRFDSTVAEIKFNSAAGDPSLRNNLPAVTQPLDLDGSLGDGQVVLAARSLAAQTGGLELRPGAARSSIRNLTFVRFVTAVRLDASDSEILGCEFQNSSLTLGAEASNNRVGGPNRSTTCEFPCNLFTGGVRGGFGRTPLIVEGGKDNLIRGNFVGTDRTGKQAIGFDLGMSIAGTGNRVGGSGEGEGNLISANGVNVLLKFGNAEVIGNRIGTDIDGRKLSGMDRSQTGISISRGSHLVRENLIGYSQTGVSVEGGINNRILSNRMIGNDFDIDLLGVFPGREESSDFQDRDTGPNGLQNAAVVERVVMQPSGESRLCGRDNGPGRLLMLWALQVKPSDTYNLQFFRFAQELLGEYFFQAPAQGGSHIVGSFVLDRDLGLDDLVGVTTTSSVDGTSEFRFSPEIEIDSDGDGVPDILERGDLNQNGVPDKCEPNVLGEIESNGLPLSARSSAQLLALLTIVDDSGGRGRILPWGRIFWQARRLEDSGPAPSLAAPGRATITLQIPPDIPVDSYLNYGPTPDNPEDHYYEFLYDGVTGAEIFDDRIVLHFVDGARGDHDLQVNDEIVTSGGPAVFPALLYFPFNLVSQGAFTGFAVSNFSSAPAVLQYEALDSSGELSPGLRNPAFFGLPASSQFARLGGEIFESPADEESIGWVRVKSTTEDVGSFFQVGAPGRLDGSVAIRETATELLFTRVFEGPTAYRGRPATTFLSVVNPNTSEVEVGFELSVPAFGQGPASRFLVLVPEQRRVIPANGATVLTVSQLFGEGLEIASGLISARALSSGGTPCGGADTVGSCGLIGYELIEIPNPGTVIGLEAALPSRAAATLRSAQLATVPLSIFTNLKVANVGDETLQVRLTPISEDGGELADSLTVFLEPKAFLERDVGTLFDYPSHAGVGSLKIEANGSGLVGDVIFGDPLEARFAAALRLQDLTFSDAVFSQVANVPGFFTGLALFNPGATAASVTIEVVRSDGESTGLRQIELPGGHRLAQTVDQLVPESAGQAGGYIRIRSTQPIVAQQLFGDSGLSLLSAVPPKVIH